MKMNICGIAAKNDGVLQDRLILRDGVGFCCDKAQRCRSTSPLSYLNLSANHPQCFIHISHRAHA